MRVGLIARKPSGSARTLPRRTIAWAWRWACRARPPRPSPSTARPCGSGRTTIALTLVWPGRCLSRASDHKEFKLLPVAKTAAAEERKVAQQVTAAALARHEREAKIISQGVHPAKPRDPPARVKIEQPRDSAGCAQARGTADTQA
jgi:hypothetical protein